MRTLMATFHKFTTDIPKEMATHYKGYNINIFTLVLAHKGTDMTIKTVDNQKVNNE